MTDAAESQDALEAQRNAPRDPSPDPILEDRLCISCGYNIRGLDDDKSCPECGVPIALSLRSALLIHADASYVRRLHLGVRVLFWSLLSILGLVGLQAALATALAVALPSGLAPPPGAGAHSHAPLPALGSVLLFGLSTLLGLVILVGLVVGFWLITTRDVGRPPSAPENRPRRIARWSLPIAFGAYFAQAGASALLFPLMRLAPGAGRPGSVALSSPFLLLWGILLCVSFAAGWVAYFALLSYLRRVARRVPSRKASARCRALGTLGIILCALATMGAASWTVMMGAMLSGAAHGVVALSSFLMAPFSCGGAVLAFVIYIMFLFLFSALSRSLDTVRRRASAEAAPAPANPSL